MPGGPVGNEPIKTIATRRVRITGRFFPQGAGAIVNASNIGKTGWTVARTGVGVYQVTLDRKYLKGILLSLGLQMNALTNLALQFTGAETVNGAGTFNITAHAAGVATEIAANANNSVSFEIEAVMDTVVG